MQSMIQLVEQASGRDKFMVLATAIERLASGQESLKSGRSIDEQIATVDVESLATDYGVSFATMRSNLRAVIGESAVFRLGKRWVIRKERFLDYLQAVESEPTEED